MAQPQWITPAGSLGVVGEGVYFTLPILASESEGNEITYQIIAGSLPAGVQLTSEGIINGVPFASINLSGVPTEVSEDVVSAFVIRASTTDTQGITRINDRTFSITVTGQDVPEFLTPAGSLGVYPDGTFIRIPIKFEDPDPSDTVVISKDSGSFPLGITMDDQGIISGIIRPLSQLPGLANGTFDAFGAPFDTLPFDPEDVIYDEFGNIVYEYEVDALDVSQRYVFDIKLSDGKDINIYTYDIVVINRERLTADSNVITVDLETITTDLMPLRPPVIADWHYNGADIGTFKRDNFFAHRIGISDIDGEQFYSVLTVDPTGSTPFMPTDPLEDPVVYDPSTGWLTGYLSNLDLRERQYKFTIQAWKLSNWTLINSATEFTPGYTYFSGDVVSYNDAYYIAVQEVTLDEFMLTDQFSVDTDVQHFFRLFDTSASYLYDFTINTVGEYGSGITWLSGTYNETEDLYELGSFANGDISISSVEAVSVNPADILRYRVVGGNLPPGLSLAPEGDIIGRISFETFSLDGGTTTFDKTRSSATGTDINTTFDSTYDVEIETYNTLETVNSVATFRITVDRVYNEPYEELKVIALPPEHDRAIVKTILGDSDVFPYPEMFRPTDLNFGVARRLSFTQAYGLGIKSLEDYAAVMQQGHYRKKVVLGNIHTARALDENGTHIYDVVYVDIVDTALNSDYESPGLAVDTAYPVTLPSGEVITEVYPNSLLNMRERIVSGIGQESDVLPRWMISRQPNGRTIGFIPAWVLAYTKPGYGSKTAFNVAQKYSNVLNTINFEIDRYELVREFTVSEEVLSDNEFLVFPQLNILG